MRNSERLTINHRMKDSNQTRAASRSYLWAAVGDNQEISAPLISRAIIADGSFHNKVQRPAHEQVRKGMKRTEHLSVGRV